MFKLNEALTIYNVETICSELKEYLNQRGQVDIYIDAENLEDIDASGIQLLLSTEKYCLKNNCALKVNNLTSHLKHLFFISGAENLIAEDNS